ncbi:unnamed protein product [Pleuronectes platessa]|uniref:Uncharacterized protein n=1 Tax=Pleuronectes platessa TaxID=8262 RepID=A0A9N7UY88_PLEPL|nr:unnamed protein product [Pleuronectes platessa]
MNCHTVPLLRVRQRAADPCGSPGPGGGPSSPCRPSGSLMASRASELNVMRGEHVPTEQIDCLQPLTSAPSCDPEPGAARRRPRRLNDVHNIFKMLCFISVTFAPPPHLHTQSTEREIRCSSSCRRWKKDGLLL